jgi:hypothetical protein
MAESIRVQELLGTILGKLKLIERHTHCTSCNTNAGGGGGGDVIVTNPADNPVNVVIVSPTTPTTQITSAGTTSPIPAGFKSISIVKTSAVGDLVTIAMSDASSYSMSLQGEVFSDSATPEQLLPAYVMTGAGTFKWHGIK